MIGETDEIAEQVVADAAAEGSLADDDDFQQWTDEVGDPGVVSMYAAPGRRAVPRRRHGRLRARCSAR